MPFENLYFYDDSIISTEPFQEGNLIHSSGQENPRVVEAPGDPCLHLDESQHPGTALYTKLRD
jgi:hypothetical protein